jgi:hypothetical protein
MKGRGLDLGNGFGGRGWGMDRVWGGFMGGSAVGERL